MHEPSFTLDLLYSGKVKTFGINNNDILSISFYEEKATDSAKYFKEVANMIYQEELLFTIYPDYHLENI